MSKEERKIISQYRLKDRDVIYSFLSDGNVWYDDKASEEEEGYNPEIGLFSGYCWYDDEGKYQRKWKVRVPAQYKTEAEKALEELFELSKQKYVPSVFIAALYMGLDQKDKAFEWLERSCEERDIWSVFLGVDPICDRLRSDPRFAGLLKKAGLA